MERALRIKVRKQAPLEAVRRGRLVDVRARDGAERHQGPIAAAVQRDLGHHEERRWE